MKFRVETISPARARRLLDATAKAGVPHRGISGTRVNKFVHAILTGQWRTTHQGLALGPNGEVLDGQHRLTAIIIADLPVKMLVIRDADPEDFGVIDTGAARTTADSLKIAGYTDVNHLSAVVRGFLTYKEVAGSNEKGFGSRIRLITTTDALEFLSDPKNEDATVAAVVNSRRIAGQLARYGLTSALAISQLCYRLMPTEMPEDTMSEFYERLGDGAMLSPSSPILALRRWYLSDTGYAKIVGQLRREVAVAATIKSANDYALGKPRSMVIFRHRVEPYPMPLPKGSRKKYEDSLAAAEAKQANQDKAAKNKAS